eukprot:4135355-Alexandrium_andersonii.AAC.1
MSASLVGSEMCIRDRSSTSPSSARSLVQAFRGSDPGCSILAKTKATESVSYTHLTLPTICSV